MSEEQKTNAEQVPQTPAEPQDGNKTPDTVPYFRFKEMVDEKNGLQEQLRLRDEQLKGLEELQKKAESVEEFKAEIEKLQAENKKTAEDYEASVIELKKDNLLSQALIKEGAINVDITKHAFAEFLKDAKIGEDGNISGLDDKVKEIKTSEQFSFCFKKDEGKPMEIAGFKPGQGSEPTAPTVQPDGNMSYEEFAKAFANPN